MRSALRTGQWTALELDEGAEVRIEAIVARQAVEVIAHARDDPRDRLSTLLTALAENTHAPRIGTPFWSQDYRPLFRVSEQSHDRHDMMLEACNPWLIEALGGRPDSPSCWANFREALGAIGLSEKWIPYPLGIFRQVGEVDGSFQLMNASSRAGDHVTLKTERAITLVISACPTRAPLAVGDEETVTVEVM